jgi:amidase
MSSTAAGEPAPTALDIAAAVRDGRRTARQAVEAALRHIRTVDARLGAFQQVRVFAALREADEVDRRPDRNELPLAGVPVAIKDNVPVAGQPMRNGSLGTDPSPQPVDHEIVRRLRAAGAVVVGLTRVPELCVFGATDSEFGITRNPWALDRTPGGSSGGSAAAVAAGVVPIAHGNDGMGSIRIPAACCGLVGVKPGSGVIPSDLGNGSWFGMAENGPLATTVADAALMFAVLAERPAAATVAVPRTLCVGVSTRVPATGVQLERHWAAAARETADLLRESGHVVREANPRYPASLALTEVARWTAGTEYDAQLVADRTLFAKRTRRHAAIGRAVLRLGLMRNRAREGWLARAQHYFADHDVLVTPALARPPLPARPWARRGWLANVLANTRYAPFAAPWNLLGWPAMTVPAGLSPAGLPLAVQLVGPPGAELTLLALAGQLEKQRPWPRTAPMAAER